MVDVSNDVRNVRCVKPVQENIKTFAAIVKQWKYWNLCLTEQKKSAKIRAIFKVSHQIQSSTWSFVRQSSHHMPGLWDVFGSELSVSPHPGALGGPGFIHNDILKPPQWFWSTPIHPTKKIRQARRRASRLPMTITGSKNQCGFATDVTGIQIWTLAKFRPQASICDDLHLPSTSVTSVDMSYTITTSQKKHVIYSQKCVIFSRKRQKNKPKIHENKQLR